MPGSIGGANSSGWTNESLFIKFFKHFIYHAKPNKEQYVLLILDNHESHMSIEAIDLCRDSGIILLTFPPHTSNKLQPLDLTIVGPLKGYYNEEVDNWHRNNPGKTFDIYNIAETVGRVYHRAFSTSNIISGFSTVGIYPLNPNIFPDSAFLVSYVSDRPFESSSPSNEQPITSILPHQLPSTYASCHDEPGISNVDINISHPSATQADTSTPIKQTSLS